MFWLKGPTFGRKVEYCRLDATCRPKVAETKREVSGMNILPKYAAVELVCFGSECLSRIKKPGAEFIRYDWMVSTGKK